MNESREGACLGGDGLGQVDGLHGDEYASDTVLKTLANTSPSQLLSDGYIAQR